MKTKRLFNFEKFATVRAVSLSVVAVVVALTVSLSPAMADDATDFDKLEKRILQVTYPKETADQRLDRLEKTMFGEAKDGSARERLDRLLSLMPVESPSTASGGNAGGGKTAQRGAGNSSPADSGAGGRSTANAPQDREDEGTSYPAVSAIEKKLFGKEFNEEPVETRLTRLEKKTFGKQSASNDLSERMDALKAKTGIDVARQPVPGTDWNDDDDEDMDFPAPTSSPTARRYPGVSPSDSGMSFSGRNVGQDPNRAFNRPGTSYGGGSGAYGMGGGSGSYGMGGGGSMSSSSSGSYGFGGSSGIYGGGSTAKMKSDYGSAANNRFGSPRSVIPSQSPDDDDDNQIAYAPRTAPPVKRSTMPPVAPSRTAGGAQSSAGAPGGITVQLDSIESQVLGKTYQQESLMQRLDRLENIVFPNDKSARSRNAPERVARLASALGGSTPMAQNQQSSYQDSYAQDPMGGQDPQIAQQQRRGGGGLGKIINSLGNFLGGGMAVGSYPMQGGNLVTDPTTGYLLDQYSGNLINPTTGAIMGRRAGVGYPATVPGYGGVNFNNGFSSPYVNPMYPNTMYGVGGSGIRFGTGGFGFGRGF